MILCKAACGRAQPGVPLSEGLSRGGGGRAAEEGAEAAGCRIHPSAGLGGSIWWHPPCGASAALEVDVADRRPLWGHSVAWTHLAEPRTCMCEGSRGPRAEEQIPSQLWPHEGERTGWLMPAEGPGKHRQAWRPGRENSGGWGWGMGGWWGVAGPFFLLTLGW